MHKKTLLYSVFFILVFLISINNRVLAMPTDTIKKKQIPIMDFKNFEPLLHQKTDTIYIINFWATWCKPCVEELPVFETIKKKYINDKVKVILVSLDLPENVQNTLLPFIQKHQIQSQIILLDDPDFNSWIEKVSPTWSGAIPATIIYNREKRKFYEQSFDYNTLTKELTSFIH